MRHLALSLFNESQDHKILKGKQGTGEHTQEKWSGKTKTGTRSNEQIS